VWNSLPDAFASAAHYLSSVGWRSGETWGQQVVLPAGFDPALADSDLRRSLAEWQASGVRGLNAPRAGVPTTKKYCASWRPRKNRVPESRR
jgi:membrane-bound lytic murein transglycosylase B